MTTDLLPDAPPSDLSQAIQRVLANWRDELMTVFGPWLIPEDDAIVLHLGKETLELRRLGPDGLESAGSLPFDAAISNADPRALRALIDRAGGGREVALCLPPDKVLRPRVSVPKASRATLAGVVAFEVERVSPVPVSELYSDFVVIGRTGQMLDIELRITRKSLLDKIISLCRAAGLQVTAIRFEGDSDGASWRNYPVDRNAAVMALLRRFRRLGFLAAMVLLMLGVLTASYARQEAILSSATEATTEAGVRAARVEKLQHSIAQTYRDLSLAAEQKHAPLLVGILAELTQALPDGTWVTEVSFDGTSVRVVGSSSSASDLIGLIDRAPRFRDAKFEAPLVHDQAMKADRFDLSFRLRGR